MLDYSHCFRKTFTDGIYDNGVFAPFWNQFCADKNMKETVRAVILRQPILDKKSLKKLLQHEFVVEHADTYKMRATIFEQWVRLHDEAFI